ncbi:hypothetical protein ACTZQ0_00955 [Oceanimonas smirnovii]
MDKNHPPQRTIDESTRKLLDELSSLASSNPKNSHPSQLKAKEADRLDEEYKREEVNGKKLDNAGKAQDNSLKKTYGLSLLGILAVQLIVMNAVFVLVGLDKLDYKDWALHLYVTGTLAEIFALVLIVTKYLFSNGK